MQEKVYKSINDMPLYNWQKCLEGDLRYVREDLKDLKTNKEDFDVVYDDYISKRGLGKEYKQYLDIIKKRALIQCDYLITKDRFKLTLIEVEDAKLEGLKKNTNQQSSIQQALIYLSKWLGYRLDWKQITVSEYYLILDEYSKQNN